MTAIPGDRLLRGPTTTDRPTFVITEDLEGDGQTYRLRFHWVQLAQRWALDASRADGPVIDYGIGLSPGVDLFAPYRSNPATPPGQLFVVAPDGASPARGGLRGAAQVYYRPAALAASVVGTSDELW